MESYHGTSVILAANIAGGHVDVSLGGGELGQGFYTGEFLYEAKAWAIHKAGQKKRNVVKFISQDSDVLALDLKMLDRAMASRCRERIRMLNQTHSFCFDCDMVWAPIVGTTYIKGTQCKWESLSAQSLLNGNNTSRVTI
jgi:hypothetical protein